MTAVTISPVRDHADHPDIGCGSGSGGAAGAVAIEPVRCACWLCRASHDESCTADCQVNPLDITDFAAPARSVAVGSMAIPALVPGDGGVSESRDRNTIAAAMATIATLPQRASTMEAVRLISCGSCGERIHARPAVRPRATGNRSRNAASSRPEALESSQRGPAGELDFPDSAANSNPLILRT